MGWVSVGIGVEDATIMYKMCVGKSESSIIMVFRDSFWGGNGGEVRARVRATLLLHHQSAPPGQAMYSYPSIHPSSIYLAVCMYVSS